MKRRYHDKTSLSVKVKGANGRQEVRSAHGHDIVTRGYVPL
jgi:hypothetical protein